MLCSKFQLRFWFFCTFSDAHQCSWLCRKIEFNPIKLANNSNKVNAKKLTKIN